MYIKVFYGISRIFEISKKITPYAKPAIVEGIKASVSKSLLYRISVLRIAPPSGARNILPIPAPLPYTSL